MAVDYLRTVYAVPAMDCAAEEQLVRMALGDVPAVVAIEVDLRVREVHVIHAAPAAAVTEALESLGFGAREVSHAMVPAPTERLGPQSRQRRVLAIVLVLNATMFVVELVAGLLAQSTGLLADSLDMLADAFVYAVVLVAVGGSLARQRRAATLSGWLMLLLAALVLVDVMRRAVMGSEPVSLAMILVGLLALVVNVTSIALLSGHREGGAHLQASWIFTTRDALANAGVIAAGVLVMVTGSAVPDLVAGVIIAGLVGTGALRILRLK
jgi:Co/Zn/Cd efflux system component